MHCPHVMFLHARPLGCLFKSSLRSFSTSTRILAPLESGYLGPMDDSRFSNGPNAQNPTALRLGEVLSTWLSDIPQGRYDQYLQTLSPAYDHLLTYSRYDRIWRFSEHSPHRLGYKSQITLLSSPMFVMDIGDNDRVTDHRRYDGTDPESMGVLESHLSSTDLDSEVHPRPRPRIICAQHITCLNMEALGSGLSLDPNVFSHHIGTSFRISKIALVFISFATQRSNISLHLSVPSSMRETSRSSKGN